MLNHIVIMGRLTRDPELRRTQSGIAVTSISVAVDRDFQSRDAQEKQTDFIDVVAWRSTAEFISKYFTKGRMIVVEGSLQSRKWQDKNGQNRVSWEIQASNVYFGDSKRDNQGDYSAPSYGGQSYSSPAESYTAPAGGGSFAEIEEDGELPF
ncbi:MAG: single-stranded DNA-binding protein [Oscillospiraceae bacterium]|nr:single-stranded DNA-binding protein [Oscillospiraceae bacterium]